MDFSTPLIRATGFVREKRFFIHADNPALGRITAHCPNTGSMKGALDTAVAVWFSRAADPARKLQYTLELAEQPDGTFTGLHTGRTNALVAEALTAGMITELAGATHVKMEAKYSAETRFDFLMHHGGRPVWLEVKNVTMKDAAGRAVFPDAVSTRGTKHLHTLAEIAKTGTARAVQLYVVNRPDCTAFAPAAHIDPAYAQALHHAIAAGVQVLAYACAVSPQGIRLDKPLPLVL